MHLIFRTALMLCTMLVFVAQALAADVRSYAVLPFKVNGSSGFKNDGTEQEKPMLHMRYRRHRKLRRLEAHTRKQSAATPG